MKFPRSTAQMGKEARPERFSPARREMARAMAGVLSGEVLERPPTEAGLLVPEKFSALASKKAKHLPIATVEYVNEDMKRGRAFWTRCRVALAGLSARALILIGAIH
jgi:hypothetical protein